MNLTNHPFNDLSGKKFGRLTVLHREYGREGVYFVCRCDCGKTVVVSSCHLVTGHTQSCGCLNREIITKPGQPWHFKRKFFTYEEKRAQIILTHMKQRCCDPNDPHYKDYGGRGIYICDEWMGDTKVFVDWAISHGYKPGLSIDRIDNDGPYAPWNCRFVTQKVQTNNQRSNHRLFVGGENLTISQWEDFLKIPKTRLNAIVKRCGDQVAIDFIDFVIGGGDPNTKVNYIPRRDGRTFLNPNWNYKRVDQAPEPIFFCL